VEKKTREVRCQGYKTFKTKLLRTYGSSAGGCGPASCGVSPISGVFVSRSQAGGSRGCATIGLFACDALTETETDEEDEVYDDEVLPWNGFSSY